jgi:hypothetical protein
MRNQADHFRELGMTVEFFAEKGQNHTIGTLM